VALCASIECFSLAEVVSGVLRQTHLVVLSHRQATQGSQPVRAVSPILTLEHAIRLWTLVDDDLYRRKAPLQPGAAVFVMTKVQGHTASCVDARHERIFVGLECFHLMRLVGVEVQKRRCQAYPGSSRRERVSGAPLSQDQTLDRYGCNLGGAGHRHLPRDQLALPERSRLGWRSQQGMYFGSQLLGCRLAPDAGSETSELSEALPLSIWPKMVISSSAFWEKLSGSLSREVPMTLPVTSNLPSPP
jgi:hypothetical protein